MGRDKDKAEAACKQTASDTPSTHGGRAALRIRSFNKFCQLWCICALRRGSRACARVFFCPVL
nr:MAG TPA: hypothetical protein [Caudoviricetes sp.]